MSKNVKKNTPKKKKAIKKEDYTTIIIFSAIVVAVALIAGIAWYVQNKDKLDTNKIYYADIAIEDYGTITVQLDQHSAPITAANFVKLANSGFYNGLTFHRIMEGFMMQGGAPKTVAESADAIVGEFSDNGYRNPLKHERGVISMARTSDMNSADSQFFIMHQTDSYLDGKYAAFGWVTKGIEIVDAICEDAEPTDMNGTIAKEDQPVITSITIRTVNK